MNTIQLLKQFGGENDQCYVAILDWFSENRGRRVNSAELSLMGFKRLKKLQHVYVPFSPSCIERKARKLAEWGLLERGYDTSHHAWYSWPVGQSVAPQKPMEVRIEERNGVKTAVLI